MPGALQRPQREGDAAHAAGRQQARRGGAGERHLVARAQVHARRAAPGDVPEQEAVAGDGDELEADGGERPSRLSGEDSIKRVGEGLRRAATQEEDGGNCRAAGRREEESPRRPTSRCMGRTPVPRRGERSEDSG